MVGCVSGLVAVLLTPLVARWARRRGLVDQPDPRKQHETPVALLGGVSVLASLALCGTVAIRLVGGGTAADEFSEPALGFLTGCALGALVLAVVGLWDDVRPAPIAVKLAAQFFSAAVLILFFRPLTGVLGPAAAAVVSVAWLVFATNSFNLLDNMDGAAPGIGALAAAFFAILATDGSVGLACAALAGALTGFLVFNRHPAKVFLGDCGSLSIGFLLGAFGLWIAGGGLPSALAVLLIFGLFLLDTCLVVVSRLRRGLNPFTTPGRDHLSHRLVALGLPIPAAVALLWAGGLVFGLAGLAVAPPPVVAPRVVIVLAAVFCLGVIIAMERTAPAGLNRSEEIDPTTAGSAS